MKRIGKAVLFLSSILSCANYGAENKCVNRNVKKRSYTKQEEQDLICSGMQNAYDSGLDEIMLWHEFDISNNNIVSYPRFVGQELQQIKAGTVFTIAVKISSDSIQSLINNGTYLYASVRYRFEDDLEDEFHEDSRNASFVYSKTSPSIKEFDSGYIKGFKLENEVAYATYTVDRDATILNINFVFGNMETKYDDIRITRGSYNEFPGFNVKKYRPCTLPNKEISGDTYIDIDYDKGGMGMMELLSNCIVAYDEEEEKYIRPTIIREEFTDAIYDKSLVGEYRPVVYAASDIYGNTSTATFYLRLVDYKAPTIRKNNDNDISFSYTLLSKEMILEYFTIFDNHILDSVELIDLDLIEARKTMGQHNFRIKATDRSNNISYYESKFLIVDDVPPVVTSPLRINTSVSEVLNVEQIKGMFKSEDEVDGTDLKITVDGKEYFDNAKKPGTYYITYKAVDKANNTTSKRVPVIVSDDNGPTFFIYEYSITSYIGELVDVLAAINSMAEAGIIKKGNYIEYQIISGQDLSNNLEAGSYTTKVLAKSDAGESIVVNLNIDIKEKEKELKAKKGFWQKIADFFRNLFASIGNFFKNLFH